MNSITLEGTIINDPELRYTSDNQTPIATARLESLQFHNGEEVPVYFKVQGWGTRNAEALKSVEAGQQVILTGSIRLNTVELDDGYKQKYAEINMSNMRVLG